MIAAGLAEVVAGRQRRAETAGGDRHPADHRGRRPAPRGHRQRGRRDCGRSGPAGGGRNRAAPRAPPGRAGRHPAGELPALVADVPCLRRPADRYRPRPRGRRDSHSPGQRRPGRTAAASRAGARRTLVPGPVSPPPCARPSPRARSAVPATACTRSRPAHQVRVTTRRPITSADPRLISRGSNRQRQSPASAGARQAGNLVRCNLNLRVVRRSLGCRQRGRSCSCPWPLG